MTDELDKLRPDVREAVDAFDIGARIGMTFGNKGWNIIRAELLRLAKENTSRPANTNETIDLMATWINRAQNAEAELAALKARIAEAPTAQLIDQGRAVQQWCVRATDGNLLALPPALSGKRVRLVVDEPRPAPEPGSLDELRIERGGSSHG